jgi:hypothetical protein
MLSRQLGQPSEHRGKPAQKCHDRFDFCGFRQAKHPDRLECGSGFGSFSSGASKARQAVFAGAAGSLRNPEVGGQQGATQLVSEFGIAARESPCQRVAESESLLGDPKRIEPLVVEGAGSPARRVLGGRVRVRVRGSILVSRKSIVGVSHERPPRPGLSRRPLPNQAQLT